MLLEQFGPDGTCYEDSRVLDLLEQDTDQDKLLALLHQIEQDWESQPAIEPGVFSWTNDGVS